MHQLRARPQIHPLRPRRLHSPAQHSCAHPQSISPRAARGYPSISGRMTSSRLPPRSPASRGAITYRSWRQSTSTTWRTSTVWSEQKYIYRFAIKRIHIIEIDIQNSLTTIRE
jgi:hypothetical protein